MNQVTRRGRGRPRKEAAEPPLIDLTCDTPSPELLKPYKKHLIGKPTNKNDETPATGQKTTFSSPPTRKQRTTTTENQVTLQQHVLFLRNYGYACDSAVDGGLGKQSEKGNRLETGRPEAENYSFTTVEAIRQFSHLLSDDERREIRQYQHVYYAGATPGDQKTLRRHRRTTSPGGYFNQGYDDSDGFYSVEPGDHDHVAYRYEIVKSLGKGSFGQVLEAYDHKQNERVALKIVKNNAQFARQAEIEIEILKKLGQADPAGRAGIVRMKEDLTFRRHRCITFELLSINLYQLIKRRNFKGLPLPIIHKVTTKILQALSFLARCGIVHADLKPENILLVEPDGMDVKLIDFGSSCYAGRSIFTYIMSRYYRAPEVILGVRNYGTSVDIWSLGCILAELQTGYPLLAGENEFDQLSLMMEILGVPPQGVLALSPRRYHFFSASRGHLPRYCKFEPVLLSQGAAGATTGYRITGAHLSPVKKRPRRLPGSRPLTVVLQSSADLIFVDFVSCLLNWDWNNRISAEGALKNRWILEGPVPPDP